MRFNAVLKNSQSLIVLKIFINNTKRNPYLKDKKAGNDLLEAIGRKRYCMETTADLRFYAVPVEDDKIIGHTFEEGILK